MIVMDNVSVMAAELRIDSNDNSGKKREATSDPPNPLNPELCTLYPYLEISFLLPDLSS